jgi:hypothetical protein
MSLSFTDDGSQGSVSIGGVQSLVFNKGGTTSKLQSVTCAQGSGALIFGLNPTVLDFRSTTLTTGVPVTRTLNTAASLALPSGGTLGAVTTVQARLILVAIDNAGTVELAVVNLAGGKSLTEEGVISTTAISASSTANNVFYSTTARTGVAYRVVGAVDAVNTAGAWGNPVLVQPMGGEALSAMSSLGYGQTWQDVSGSRAIRSTYTNTTGKPIVAIASYSNSVSNNFYIYAGGSPISRQDVAAGVPITLTIIVPSGTSYAFTDNTTGTPTLLYWWELR